MLAFMRLCAPRSSPLLLISCLRGFKAPLTSQLLLNASWNRTFATGTRKTDKQGSPNDPRKVQSVKMVESAERVAKEDRGKKTAPVTAEEDALIARRVADWGDKGRGLWTSLEHEMGRNAKAIARRYKAGIVLDRSSARTYWTSLMDARLKEGVALHKENDGWARVAEHLGGGVTAEQCRTRWSHYISKAQQKGIKQGDWSDEEVRQLEELVPQHMSKPQHVS